MSCGRDLIYQVLKTAVKRHLCSNVVATSIQRQKKKDFFLSCTVRNIQKILGQFQFRSVLRYDILEIIKILQPHLLTNFTESEEKKHNHFSRSRSFDFHISIFISVSKGCKNHSG